MVWASHNALFVCFYLGKCLTQQLTDEVQFVAFQPCSRREIHSLEVFHCRPFGYHLVFALSYLY